VYGDAVYQPTWPQHFDEKRAIIPKWVMGFSSKLWGR
jgi:hypothetical protein